MIAEAMNKEIVHVHWGRDPKNHRKMRVEAVDLNLTTGFVLGAVGLAMLYEAAAWLSNAISQGKGGPAVVDLAEFLSPAAFIVLTEMPAYWNAATGLASALSNPLTVTTTTPAGTPPSVVKVPPTAGAAFNLMVRDLIVAGPGTWSKMLANLTAGAVAGRI